MIEPELAARLDAIEAKAEAARIASEKVRRSLLWGRFWGFVIFVLPLIALAFVIPSFLNNLTGMNGSYASYAKLLQQYEQSAKP